MNNATTAVEFFPCNAAKQPLLSVAPGVPCADALNQAYCFLDVAEELSAQLSDPGHIGREQTGHACNMLIQLAKAVICACAESMVQEVSHV